MSINDEILLVGPQPPPYGGQSVLIDFILDCSLAEQYNVKLFNVSHNSPGPFVRFLLSVIFLFRFITFLVLRRRVSLVHVHTSATNAFFEKSFFIFVARVFGCRTVLHLHGGKLRELWNGAYRLKKLFLKQMLNLNNALIVLSPATEDFLVKTIKYDGPIFTLPNSIPTPCLNLQKSKTHLVVFLFVGHLKVQKGLLDLFEAVRILPAEIQNRIEIRIMGKGDTSENESIVKTAFSGSGLTNVFFLGVKSGQEKWQEFVQADVFLLPSHSEDMPITILEAMACGLPVLATHVGAIPEVVRHNENGFLVPPASPSVLAEKIEALAADEVLRCVMGRKNRLKFEADYSFEEYERRLAAIYDEILA